MPIGDCRRVGAVDRDNPVFVLKPIAPIKPNLHCWEVVNTQPQKPTSNLKYTLARADGSPVVADLSQLNQLNFAFNRSCLTAAERSKLEDWLMRDTWTNSVWRRAPGVNVRYNGVTLGLDKLRYFVQSANFAQTGFYKAAISIMLPIGVTFDHQDTICIDHTTMSCVPRTRDGSGRVEYVFYLRGERYCPLLLTSVWGEAGAVTQAGSSAGST